MDESFLNVISSANDDSILMPRHLNATMHGGQMTNTIGRKTLDDGDDRTVSSQVIVWCFFAAIVFCLCLRPGRWDPSYRSSMAERERRIRRALAKKDPAHRKRVINKFLITKSVIECDEDGNLTLGDVDHDGRSVGQSCTSCSSNDDYSNACVICLEAFRVGDTVSWSKDMSCLHVFHHDCILQWLENPEHDDCPSCRYNIVNFNYDDSSDCGCCHEEEEDDLDIPSSAPIAFIIIDGLISRARQASFSLIGNSVDTHTPFGDIPPTIDLRRVLSEGSNAVGVRTISLLHRLSFRRGSSGAYSRIVTPDTVDSDVESQLPSTDDALSLKRPIRMRRSVSEGAFYKSISLPMGEPAGGLNSSSRVSFRRVSSGLYSRISSRFDSADPSKSYLHDDVLDEEEDILTDEYDSADQPSNTKVNLEKGVSNGLVRVV